MSTAPTPGPEQTVGEWREDGTGKEQVDGTPTTCDSAFNRGYDAGYLVGLESGTPPPQPVRSPRWDQDPVVRRFGWLAGRCGNCGERVPGGEWTPVEASNE